MLDTIFFEFFLLLDVVLCVISLMDLGDYKMQTYFCVCINAIVTVSLQKITTISCLFSK